ncbi:MAG TPA: phosphoribosylanthranilate isomerase, partial [Chloroflexota bacterium]|nr:phosphoribosylanthranilate isomerase [Chloroflexota bacterium]
VVKICGMRRVEDILAVRDAGADFIGVVFAPSPRQVSLEVARTLLIAVPRRPPAIGVFVNAPVNEINKIAALTQLAYVQLAGEESAEDAAQLDVPYVKVVHLSPGDGIDRALSIMSAHHHATAFVLDRASPQGGGSGQPVDWTLAAEIVRHAERPVLIAGGLVPETVAQALATTGAQGADVSSGVERNGWKDAGLIRQFVQAARAPHMVRELDAAAPATSIEAAERE